MKKSTKTQQEIWLNKAIDKIGCANKLAIKIKCNRCNISRWRKISKKIKPDKDLMLQHYALLIQKATKIKGIAAKLCPSIKKIKKM